MLVLSLIAQVILGAFPVSERCEHVEQGVCVALMQRVFASADPQNGRAVRLIERERWIARPVDAVDLGDVTALIVRFDKEERGGHVESGRYSAYYFENQSSPQRLVSVFRDFELAGTWGHGGSATVVMLDGVTPALVVRGGGTWQGHTCSWVSFTMIRRDGPVAMGHFLTSAHTPTVSLDAALVGAPSAYDMEVRYSGTYEGAAVDEAVVFQLVDGRLRRTEGREFQVC